MTIYIHIGLPATGAAYFQRCLLLNRREFLESRVLVPFSGSSVPLQRGLSAIIAHHELAWALLEDQSAFPAEERKWINVSWSALAEDLRIYSPKDVIISSEVFAWSLRTPSALDFIRSKLQPHNVKFIIVNRPEAVIAGDLYLQARRLGFEEGLIQFLESYRSMLNFGTTISNLRQMVGSGDLIEFDYDDLQYPCYFRSILKRISDIRCADTEHLTYSSIASTGLFEQYVSSGRTMDARNIKLMDYYITRAGHLSTLSLNPIERNIIKTGFANSSRPDTTIASNV